MEDTDWNRYGVGRDPACDNCMAHCGFEGTAVDDASPTRSRRSSRRCAARGSTVRWRLNYRSCTAIAPAPRW